MANVSEDPIRNHYWHGSVPEHHADLIDQAKNPQAPQEETGEKGMPTQGVIFERRHITLLNKALHDPSHRLRQAAEQAMQGFTMAAERDEITTLNRAAIDYHIPVKNLSEWVAKGVIPYESRDKYAIYVRRETLDKVAPVYHEAKVHGKLAAPLLKKMHDELFPASPASSQK
jgi:hypothetical protein